MVQYKFGAVPVAKCLFPAITGRLRRFRPDPNSLLPVARRPPPVCPWPWAIRPERDPRTFPRTKGSTLPACSSEVFSIWGNLWMFVKKDAWVIQWVYVQYFKLSLPMGYPVTTASKRDNNKKRLANIDVFTSWCNETPCGLQVQKSTVIPNVGKLCSGLSHSLKYTMNSERGGVFKFYMMSIWLTLIDT